MGGIRKLKNRSHKCSLFSMLFFPASLQFFGSCIQLLKTIASTRTPLQQLQLPLDLNAGIVLCFVSLEVCYHPYLCSHSWIKLHDSAQAARTRTIDWVAQTTEIYFLMILKLKSLTSSCWQGCFILMSLSLVCRCSSSHCIFTSSLSTHLCLNFLLIRTPAILN